MHQTPRGTENQRGCDKRDREGEKGERSLGGPGARHRGFGIVRAGQQSSSPWAQGGVSRGSQTHSPQKSTRRVTVVCDEGCAGPVFMLMLLGVRWEVALRCQVTMLRADSSPPSSVSVETHWSEADAVLMASAGRVVERPLEGSRIKSSSVSWSPSGQSLGTLGGGSDREITGLWDQVLSMEDPHIGEVVETSTLWKAVGVWAGLEETHISLFEGGCLLSGAVERRGATALCRRFRPPAHGQTAARSQKRARNLALRVLVRDGECRSNEVSIPVKETRVGPSHKPSSCPRDLGVPGKSGRLRWPPQQRFQCVCVCATHVGQVSCWLGATLPRTS